MYQFGNFSKSYLQFLHFPDRIWFFSKMPEGYMAAILDNVTIPAAS